MGVALGPGSVSERLHGNLGLSMVTAIWLFGSDPPCETWVSSFLLSVLDVFHCGFCTYKLSLYVQMFLGCFKKAFCIKLHILQLP